MSETGADEFMDSTVQPFLIDAPELHFRTTLL